MPQAFEVTPAADSEAKLAAPSGPAPVALLELFFVCLPSGGVGSILGWATSTTDYLAP